MRTLSCTQGTEAWHAERAGRFTASEAPAMMGASKFLTRSDLLKQKHSGLVPEVSAQQQALYDRGHAAEAAARTLLEDDLGDLFPVTALHDTDDRLLASMDGITLDDSTLFEHKLWSESLAAKVRTGELDPHYVWQLEHQLLVAGAERVVFVCSDGTRQRWAQCEYRPVPGRREQLLAGWDQFAKDLAEYAPAAPAAAAVVAAPVQSLPAVSVQVTGSITVIDNFDRFEKAFSDFVEHRLIREPKTDQDFADLDNQIKAMKGAEAGLEAGEANMLAQISPVDAAKKKKDMLSKLVRDYRLMAEKLLASEKERRRGEIVAGGIAALRDYIVSRNDKLGRPYMPQIPADFAGCIKGKSNLAKMEDAVATELARAKIAATEVFDRIQTNLATIAELATDFPALIPDRDLLVLKAPDDCRAALTSRIAAHQAAEAKRMDAERERIRAEEVARIAREQQETEARATREREAEEARARLAAAPAPTPAPPAAVVTAPNVVPIQRPAVPPVMAAAMPATLNLGAINARLGFTMSADFIGKRLGVEPAATEKSARLFTEHQYQLICEALVAHVRTAQVQQAA